VEKNVIARGMRYGWPPSSWGALTIPQLMRIVAVEQEMSEATPAPPPSIEPPEDE